MRHTQKSAEVNRVTEESLFYIGERRAQLEKQSRLEQIVGGLEEASRIEHLRLEGHVKECEAQLREAREDLSRFQEIDAQRSEIHVELMQLAGEELALENEASRAISTAAKEAGFAYGREELIANGGLQRIVDARKAGTLSQREAEAI